MTRPLRIEFKNAVYHFTSKGNAQQAIFLDEKDFADFLRVLCQVVKIYRFILHAYLSCEQPLSSKDIAEYTGVHYATVSRAVKKIEREDER